MWIYACGDQKGGNGGLSKKGVGGRVTRRNRGELINDPGVHKSYTKSSKAENGVFPKGFLLNQPRI